MPLYDKSAFLIVRADSEEEAERFFDACSGIELIVPVDISTTVAVTLSTDDGPAEELDD